MWGRAFQAEGTEKAKAVRLECVQWVLRTARCLVHLGSGEQQELGR